MSSENLRNALALVSTMDAVAPLPGIAAACELIAKGTGSRLSEDDDNALSYALVSDYPFLAAERVSRRTPNTAEMRCWAELLAWMTRSLNVWSQQGDPEGRRLACLLFIAGCIDRDGAFWSCLPSDVGANQALLIAVERRLPVRHPDLHDVNILGTHELVDRYLQAQSGPDWVAIGDLQPHLDLNYVDATFRPALRLLRRFEPGAVVRFAAMIEDTAIATALLAEGEPGEVLDIAAGSGNPRVVFVATYVLTSPKATTLTLAEQRRLADLLTAIADSPCDWASWMVVFNAYPVRFPGLQQSLGISLARVGKAALNAYIRPLILSNDPLLQRALVIACLKVFTQEAALEVRRSFWEILHRRWDIWNYGISEPNSSLLDVQASDLDYAVVGYCLECLASEELVRKIEILREQVRGVTGRWHGSLVSTISERNRLRSRLRVLCHAATVPPGEPWSAPPIDPVVAESEATTYERLTWSLQG